MDKDIDIDIPKLMGEAYLLASESPDPSCQNGAVLVDFFNPTTIIGVGFNGFGPVKYTDEQLNNRVWKLDHIEHAERAALFDASKSWPTDYTILVCPWAACTDCARAIGAMGVRKVIVHEPRMRLTGTRWLSSVDYGLQILNDYGCAVEYWNGDVELGKHFSIKVDGKNWNPLTNEFMEYE